MPEIYLLSLVIGLAAVFGILVKRFKLPLLVSYIAAGAFLSATHIVKPEQLKFLAILPEIGLAFLLFLVGMELDLREFKSLGKNVLLATVGQVVITTAVCLSVSLLLGLPMISGILIGLAIAFSSTILVVKLLLESRELSTIYGKLSIGILLIEDLLAVLVLMMVTVFGANSQGVSGSLLGLVLVKGAILMLVSFLAGKFVLPKLFESTAQSSELLFLTAIGWCMLFVSLSVFLEFSLAIGAFLAGVSLAQSVYRVQISGRIKPLRDFFIMIFFLDLGTGLTLSGLSSTWISALGILFFVAVLKPVIFFLLFTAFRFRAHTAFQTGALLSSISEFSLILITAASKQGLIPHNLLSPFIFATVFSFVSSSILVSHGRGVYGRIRGVLKTFEDAKPIHFETLELGEVFLEDHAILVGCHRSGGIVLKKLEKIYGKNLVVLDFNPEVVKELKQRSIPCLFGDISDPEVLESLKLKDAKLIVSTIRDISDNLILLDATSKIKSKATIIVTAQDASEEAKLLEKGASQVTLPTDLEGHYISGLIKDA